MMVVLTCHSESREITWMQKIYSIVHTHPVFIDMNWPEVRVVEEFSGLQVYRGLTMTLVAQAPVWIYKSPKGWTCQGRQKIQNLRIL